MDEKFVVIKFESCVRFSQVRLSVTFPLVRGRLCWRPHVPRPGL